MPIVSWSDIQSYKNIEAIFSQRGFGAPGFDILFYTELTDEQIELIQNPPTIFDKIISTERHIIEKAQYFNCLLLSNTTLSLSEVMHHLKLNEPYALYASFISGNNKLAQELKNSIDIDDYLNRIKAAIEFDTPDFLSESSVILILNDLLDVKDNETAKTLLSSLINNNNVMQAVVQNCIREDNFDLLNKILTHHPKVFDELNGSNPSLLALAKYPTYLPSLTTVFNKTRGDRVGKGLEFIDVFIEAKYATLGMFFDPVKSSVDIPLMEEKELYCCLIMIRALILLNMPESMEKIRTLLSIPQVKEMAHKKLTSERPNELLAVSKSANNSQVTALLLEIPAVNRAVAIVSSQNDLRSASITNSQLDGPRFFGTESAQVASSDDSTINKFLSFLKHYPLPTGLNHPADDLKRHLESGYASNPSVVEKDNGTKISLPLNWSDFKELGLNTEEHARALNSYYKNINHTAWRFLLSHNPWMSEDPYSQDTGSAKVKNTIGRLWLAAKDSSHPPLDGMALTTRVDEFIARLADMGRSNNLNSTSPDNPVCEMGMLGQLAFAVTSHPLYRVVEPGIIEAMFNEYMCEVFANRITVENQSDIKNIYKKLVDFDDLTPDECGTLVALDLSKGEVAVFQNRVKSTYGNAYANSETFTSFLNSSLSLQGIYRSQFEKYAAVLNLDNLLNKPLVQPNSKRRRDPEPTTSRSSAITHFRSSKTSDSYGGTCSTEKGKGIRN